MPKKKSKYWYRYRDVRNAKGGGRFVSPAYAKRHPNTTMRERVERYPS